ncbi:MAG: iron-sulfur cluster assembly accessory protein [Nitrospirota bacterium]
MEKTENMISLTDSALNEVKTILQNKQLTDSFLRVGVKQGGCTGMTYQLTFEQDTKKEDTLFEVDGLRVAVDGESVPYLSGMTLDFSRDLVGGGFKFINPNAKRSCGCGESFSA